MWKNYGNLLEILFPTKCLFCKKLTGSLICRECLDQVQIADKTVFNLGKIEVTAPFEYDGIIQDCIKASKYGSKQFAVLTIVAKAAIEYIQNLGISFEGYTAVPIPLNPRKYRIRGFNQAEIIARVLAREYKLPLASNLIQRTKKTESQFKLSREQRKVNISGAFSCKRNLVKNRKILVIDDICTTGTTLQEASKVLMEAGVKEVKAFCLSRVS